MAPSRVVIKSRSVFVFLESSKLIRIESSGHFTFFYTTKERYETRVSMAVAEANLQYRAFLRISRFHIVNLDHVVRIEHWFRGQYRFVLDEGTALIASRGYRDRIRGVLENTAWSLQ